MKRTLIGTQLRGLPKQFGQLLDLMQEHAQMEERIIFPALEMADPGIEWKDLVKFAEYTFFYAHSLRQLHLPVTWHCGSE
jgi:hypothetical protein